MKLRLALLLLLSGAVQAQSQPDAEATGGWEGYGQARLRADQVKDLPNGGEVDRVRLHVLAGARRLIGERLEMGAAVRLATGDDRNADNVRFLDNTESDEAELGEAWLRWYASPASLLEAGRAPLPLALSEMVWDADLRPTGVSWQYDFEVATFDRLSFLAGAFGGLHIDESDTRLDTIQASYLRREGAPDTLGVHLTYLDFSDLEVLIEDGRGRTNARIGNRYLSDYEMLSLRVEKSWLTPLGPLLTEVDLVSNLGADSRDQGGRLTVVMGDARRGGWEFGAAWQRVQRDAVLAAVNEDDWWFPSAMRGFMPWLAYGFSDALRLRLAAFVERRDDRDEHLKRLLLDVVVEVP